MSGQMYWIALHCVDVISKVARESIFKHYQFKSYQLATIGFYLSGVFSVNIFISYSATHLQLSVVNVHLHFDSNRVNNKIHIVCLCVCV